MSHVPENLLYSNGFASQHDQEKMAAFHETDDWGKRNQIVNELDDFRFCYLGKRLIYQNQSDALSKEDYNAIHSDIAKKILLFRPIKKNVAIYFIF